MLYTVASELHEFKGLQTRDPFEQKQASREVMQRIQQKQASVRQGIDQNLEQTLSKLQRTANIFNTKLSFSVHQNTHRVVVRIIDNDTNQVIRQIPSDEALNIADQIQKIIGMFVDRQS